MPKSTHTVPRSRIPASSSSLFSPQTPELTPEQALWIRVLARLHQDVSHHGNQQFTSLTREERCRLEYVAMAIGFPDDTLPRLMRAARLEFAARPRKEGSNAHA
jgi:hypothetical protein